MYFSDAQPRVFVEDLLARLLYCDQQDVLSKGQVTVGFMDLRVT